MDGYLPIKDGTHSSTVGTVSVDMEARCQQDAIFYCDWAMREWGDKELVPAWVQKKNTFFKILVYVRYVMDSKISSERLIQACVWNLSPAEVSAGTAANTARQTVELYSVSPLH